MFATALVGVFLWQLLPDGLQGDLLSFAAVAGVYFSFFSAWRTKCDSPALQWVQIWRVSVNPDQFCMTLGTPSNGVVVFVETV